MLINVDRDLCIGAAPCVAIAGNVFQLDDEGKAIVVGPSTDDTNTRLAAEACPVRAIFLYDNNKKQIYPSVEEMARPYVEEKVAEEIHHLPANDNQIPPLTNNKPANDNHPQPPVNKAKDSNKDSSNSKAA